MTCLLFLDVSSSFAVPEEMTSRQADENPCDFAAAQAKAVEEKRDSK